MMLKVNNEYIDLVEYPEMTVQSKAGDAIDAAGDFSYQFDLPNLSRTRRIIGLLGLDRFEVAAELTSNGDSIYTGTLIVENITKDTLSCSFISGNTNWFAMLENKRVVDIPLVYTEQFKYPLINISPSPDLVAAWSNTEGIVFPLVDRGNLRDFSTQRLNTSDFLAATYVREIVNAIFASNGLKNTGELFDDGLYNTLIVGSEGGNASAFSEENVSLVFKNIPVFVGTSGQAINTTPQKLLFDLLDYPYDPGSQWDSLNNKFESVPYDMTIAFDVTLSFDSTVDYTIRLYVNGVPATSRSKEGVIFLNETISVNADKGDDIEVYISIASGTTNITRGTLRSRGVRLLHYYPQFLVGEVTQYDFIKSVFTMFNVVPTYDRYTKTVTCNLFESLRSRPANDLSKYVTDWQINTVDILSDLSKDVIFQHQANSSQEIETYNEQSDVPFGAGVISPNRKLLSGQKEIETIFTATKDYFNSGLKASLMNLDSISYETGNPDIDITSVSDDGSGIAVFTTADDHGLKTNDTVTITTTISGDYIGVGTVLYVSDTQFKVRYLSFVVDTTGSAAATSANSSVDNDKIYIASYFHSMPVSDFSFNGTINYEGTNYSNVAWAYFLKENQGLPIDDLRKTPAFGHNNRYNAIDLLESYYSLYRSSIDNPVKVMATMLMPENVYKQLDLSYPVTISVNEWSYRFFIQKIVGYKGSEYTCEFELLKLI